MAKNCQNTFLPHRALNKVVYFNEVDKLQRYFLKRILKIPQNTPNYAIDIETNVDDAHVYTLQLHLQYIAKTLFKYENHRLPNFLSKIIVEKQIFWMKSINELLSNHGIQRLRIATSESEWNFCCIQLLQSIKTTNNRIKIEKARESRTRIYRHLDYSRGPFYMNDLYTPGQITWIIKARCDMIFLNSRSHGREAAGDGTCTICNLRETETLQHFLGRCPIMKSIRRRIFGTELLTQYDIIQILDGRQNTDWQKLVEYLKYATYYRNIIINEFE